LCFSYVTYSVWYGAAPTPTKLSRNGGVSNRPVAGSPYVTMTTRAAATPETVAVDTGQYLPSPAARRALADLAAAVARADAEAGRARAEAL
jgi:hypothetical protein